MEGEDEGIVCDKCHQSYHLNCLAEIGNVVDVAILETDMDWICHDRDALAESDDTDD